jgi:hypothetical protein
MPQVTTWPSKNTRRLLGGKSVDFNFVVPSRQDYFRFRAHKIKGSEFNGQLAAVIIEMANPLLDLLTEPIIVMYDAQTRKLVEYRGLSNISDSNGSNYEAYITYTLDDIGMTSPH